MTDAHAPSTRTTIRVQRNQKIVDKKDQIIQAVRDTVKNHIRLLKSSVYDIDILTLRENLLMKVK